MANQMNPSSSSAPRPLTNEQRCGLFGQFAFKPAPTEGNPEAINIIGDWRSKNIVLIKSIGTWNGSFVPRYKRGKAGGSHADLSNHSWGTAFDIDAQRYPLGKVVAADAPIRKLVPLAHEHGWLWGGDFKSRPDGMHFEYVGARK